MKPRRINHRCVQCDRQVSRHPTAGHLSCVLCMLGMTNQEYGRDQMQYERPRAQIPAPASGKKT